MENLTKIKCKPCEGGVDPLTRAEFEQYLEQVPGWIVVDDKKIEREFQFRDFPEALAFVNRVGAVAEEEGHHPDLCIHDWNKVKVVLWTHAIGGLSINDFVLAVRTDRV